MLLMCFEVLSAIKLHLDSPRNFMNSGFFSPAEELASVDQIFQMAEQFECKRLFQTGSYWSLQLETKLNAWAVTVPKCTRGQSNRCVIVEVNIGSFSLFA